MISLELLAKHMAWANQEIYKEVKKLDPEVLDYFVVDKEWTVRTIMVHIIFIVRDSWVNHFQNLNLT